MFEPSPRLALLSSWAALALASGCNSSSTSSECAKFGDQISQKANDLYGELAQRRARNSLKAAPPPAVEKENRLSGPFYVKEWQVANLVAQFPVVRGDSVLAQFSKSLDQEIARFDVQQRYGLRSVTKLENLSSDAFFSEPTKNQHKAILDKIPDLDPIAKKMLRDEAVVLADRYARMLSRLDLRAGTSGGRTELEILSKLKVVEMVGEAVNLLRQVEVSSK